MSKLHIFSKSPYSHTIELDALLNAISTDDKLMLINDGTYLCAHEQFSAFKCPVFSIDSETKARGISVDNRTCLVDYDRFVELTVAAESVITWA